jgi:hypothetical protein
MPVWWQQWLLDRRWGNGEADGLVDEGDQRLVGINTGNGDGELAGVSHGWIRAGAMTLAII